MPIYSLKVQHCSVHAYLSLSLSVSLWLSYVRCMCNVYLAVLLGFKNFKGYKVQDTCLVCIHYEVYPSRKKSFMLCLSLKGFASSSQQSCQLCNDLWIYGYLIALYLIIFVFCVYILVHSAEQCAINIPGHISILDRICSFWCCLFFGVLEITDHRTMRNNQLVSASAFPDSILHKTGPFPMTILHLFQNLSCPINLSRAFPSTRWSPVLFYGARIWVRMFHVFCGARFWVCM